VKAVPVIRSGLRAKIFATAVSLLLVGNGWAGLFEDEDARRAILDLRQQLDIVKRESDTKIANEVRRSTEDETQLRRSLIELQNQLEGLRTELSKLRGQNEQIAREVADLQRMQKDTLQATEDRIRKLEPISVTVDGREFLTEPAEKRDFDAGLAIFRKSEFANAQLAFVDFLNRYSQSGYRPSALFWLANAQYATKDYKEALINFRSLLTQAPDHVRAPEAMLAIANCQAELKELKAARKTLEDLVATHPASDAARAAKERLTRLK
jgi:tol-pal system protein YbgF